IGKALEFVDEADILYPQLGPRQSFSKSTSLWYLKTTQLHFTRLVIFSMLPPVGPIAVADKDRCIHERQDVSFFDV
ncbi:hypothetical protein AALP_AA7G066300, partial [Arabis alpina]